MIDTNHRQKLFVLTIFLISLASSIPSKGKSISTPSQTDGADYEIVNSMNMSVVEDHVRYLSSLETRASGYPGNSIAAQYVHDRLVEYNLENVTSHRFNTTECIDHGANITFQGTLETMRIYPMRPNLVSPSTTPPEGITGRLVYVGDGQPEDFDGQPIEGSIIVMNWQTEYRWITALELGAKAVLFLGPTEPENTPPEQWNRLCSVKMVEEVPLKFPRFYVSVDQASLLLSHLGEDVTVCANTYWEKVVTQNVFGFVEGTDPTVKDQIVMITAHYDSYSDAPSYAPGAQEACGVAAFLELARYFSEHPAKHTLLFVAYGAHNPDLEGSSRFITDYFHPCTDPQKQLFRLTFRVLLQLNIDLDTTSDTVIWLPVIHTEGGWEGGGDLYNLYGDLSSYIRKSSSEINTMKPTGSEYNLFVYTQDQTQDYAFGSESLESSLFSWFRKKYDHEWLVAYGHIYGGGIQSNFGILASSFTTAYFNKYLSHPFDNINHVRYENLHPQVELIGMLIQRLVNEDNFKTRFPGCMFGPKAEWNYGNEMAAWISMYGRVAYYNKEEAWYTEVPEAIVILEKQNMFTSYNNRFIHKVTFTDEEGRFEIYKTGMSDGYGREKWVFSAWVVNASTGDIISAPDYGIHKYAGPLASWRTGRDLGFLAVFNCSMLVMSKVYTPVTLNIPQNPELGSYREAVLSVYTSDFLPQESYGSWRGEEAVTGLYVLAVPPRTPVKVSLAEKGSRYPYLFLTNSSEETPLGWGYVLEHGQQFVVTQPALRYALDYYQLAQSRFNTLAAINPKEFEGSDYLLFDTGLRELNRAEDAIDRYRYIEYSEHSNNAIVRLLDGYTYSRVKSEDASFAVPFFSLCSVPFVILFEKLTFNAHGRKKYVSLIGTFAVTMLALYFLHPGFSMASSPTMNAIGFVMLILSLPLVIIMASRFLDYLRFMRRSIMGRHEVEVARGGYIISAYVLGVENMRKRRLRSTLITVSLILTVSGLLGLTSVAAIRTTRTVSEPWTASYDGILIHKFKWGHGAYDLGKSMVEYLCATYREEATVAPRAWIYPFGGVGGVGDQDLRAMSNLRGEIGWKVWHEDKVITAHQLWGLTPQEAQVSNIDILLEEGGRWFLEKETNVVILPSSLAERLGVKVFDKVEIANGFFTVVGIAQSAMFYFPDLDGEWISPIKFNLDIPGENPWNIHVTDEYTIVLPYDTVMLLGGGVCSVALKPKNPNIIQNMSAEVFARFRQYSVYSAVNGKVDFQGTGLELLVLGFEYQVVPLALVALSILNTMLGSVHERKREISIMSYVGLSPSQTAFIFLAETTVYALVGGILGYIASMVMMQMVTSLVIPGLELNYSSSGLVSSVGVCMTTILVSSIYPLAAVAKLVTPSLERLWSIPTSPVDDNWEIPLPFYYEKESEASQILAFLNEFLTAHLLEDSEIFRVTNAEYGEAEEEGTRKKELAMTCDVRPYERGVRQKAILSFTKPESERRWAFKIFLKREDGSMGDWISLNRRFIDSVRKQILLWGSLPEEDRGRYKEIYHNLVFEES